MVLAPMPGAVVLVDAAKGNTVKRGERLLVLQAMKMEYSLVAPFDGTVTDLTVSAGSQVKEGALLARIEKAELMAGRFFEQWKVGDRIVARHQTHRDRDRQSSDQHAYP